MHRPRTTTHARTRPTPLLAILALALCAGGFVAGRLSADARASAGASAPRTKCAAPGTAANLAAVLSADQVGDEPRPRTPDRAILTPPLHLAEVRDEEAAEQLRKYEQMQARDLVGLLRARVRQAAFLSGRDDVPEQIAVQMGEYMAGWVDAVIRTAPTLAEDLAAEVETALCDPESKASEILLFARLGRNMPELTSAAGFQCVLGSHSQEDAVLWEVLDSLQASNLPPPGALQAIAEQAHDERTLRRLQAIADRDPAAQTRTAKSDGTVSEYRLPSVHNQEGAL